MMGGIVDWEPLNKHTLQWASHNIRQTLASLID